jgi:hypothetical protein
MRSWLGRWWVGVVMVAAALGSCSSDGPDPTWLSDCVRLTTQVVPGDPSETEVRRYCTCLAEDVEPGDVEATETCKEHLR